jgi:hypothetical protein
VITESVAAAAEFAAAQPGDTPVGWRVTNQGDLDHAVIKAFVICVNP